MFKGETSAVDRPKGECLSSIQAGLRIMHRVKVSDWD